VTRRERIRSWFRQLAWGFDPAVRVVIRGPAEIFRQVRDTQRAYDSLADAMAQASRQVVGFDPGEPGGDRTVIARVCAGQVHQTDSGLLSRDDERMSYSCGICGHTWDMAELTSARHLEAVGIISRLILVTEPDADECIVLGERADVRTGRLLRGPTIIAIAQQIESGAYHTQGASHAAEIRAASSSFEVSVPLTSPRESFDALAAAVVGTREEPAESSSALAPPARFLPPYRAR
jgi:hypothetical protein